MSETVQLGPESVEAATCSYENLRNGHYFSFGEIDDRVCYLVARIFD